MRANVGQQEALGKVAGIVHGSLVAKPAFDLASLTPDEKLSLIDDIWGSLRPEDLMPSPELQAELDRRLERLDQEGPIGTPWEAVRAQMSPSRS